MNLIEAHIHSFLDKAKKDGFEIPESVLAEFSKSVSASLVRQFEKGRSSFSLRMSSIGRPLCVLQMEQKYGFINSNPIRNLYGDIVEHIVMFLLRVSGITVVSSQERVSLNIAGITLEGTLDVILDLSDGPKVWDIKSASDYAFRDKLENGFEGMLKDDPFGYISQLFLYSASKKIPVGGWIIVNKSNGDLLFIEAPKSQKKLCMDALKKAEDNIEKLLKKEPFQRQFADIPETFKKKQTGNRILCTQCSLCDYKNKCWKLKSLPQINSKSKNPKIIDYTFIKDV